MSTRILDRAELAELVQGVAATSSLWHPVVRTDLSQRWYAPLFETSAVQVWLISWGAGHDLRLHDHGPSAGAFTVASGELTERSLVSRSPQRFSERAVAVGEWRSFSAGYVHALANRATSPAISVHAYSPPLTEMHEYDATTLQQVGELPVGELESVS